jgi:putative oxidoreductase
MARNDDNAFGLLPLRLGLGVVFAVYGWNKLMNLSGTADMFASWGIPAAGTTVVLVAIAEFFGGLGLLAGVLTRFSSAVLSVVLLTAMITVKIPGPLQGGYALDLALLAGAVTLLVNGPGRATLWSLVGSVDNPVASLLREDWWPAGGNER